MNALLWLLWSIFYGGKSHHRSDRPEMTVCLNLSTLDFQSKGYATDSCCIAHALGAFLGVYHQAVNAIPPKPRARVLLQKLNTNNFRARPPGNHVSNIKAFTSAR